MTTSRKHIRNGAATGLTFGLIAAVIQTIIATLATSFLENKTSVPNADAGVFYLYDWLISLFLALTLLPMTGVAYGIAVGTFIEDIKRLRSDDSPTLTLENYVTRGAAYGAALGASFAILLNFIIFKQISDQYSADNYSDSSSNMASLHNPDVDSLNESISNPNIFYSTNPYVLGIVDLQRNILMFEELLSTTGIALIPPATALLGAGLGALIKLCKQEMAKNPNLFSLFGIKNNRVNENTALLPSGPNLN